MRWRSLALVVLTAVAGAWRTDAQTAQGEWIVIIEPAKETILVGRNTFRVGILAGSPPVRMVVYQVDGVEACRSTTAPFACEWDAGSRVASRDVRAVATFEDGSRLTKTVRTSGLTVKETAGVDKVLVSVHVSDNRGRFVPGLTERDFTILEDGQRQVAQLVDAGQMGAEVLLALDASGSMTPQMDELRTVVRGFLGALRPVDRITLAAFNTDLYVIANRDADAAARAAALNRITPGGGTAIFDTLLRGVEVLRAQAGRRALILFTDGDDVSSQASLETARTALQTNDVLLFVVATGKAASDPALKRRFTALALETGGAAYLSGNLSDTDEHFSDIVEDLSHRYLLSFSPTRPLGDGRWRGLTVELSNRRYTVRARQGYFATRRAGG